jgi:hypothetical protein
VSALEVEVPAIFDQSSSAALLCGDRALIESMSACLAILGSHAFGPDSTTMDPDTLEVNGAEVLLIVLLEESPDGLAVRELSAGEVAYAVGSRARHLSEVTGGPLQVLARVGRRVRGFRLTCHDPDVAAREIVRLWPLTEGAL